MRQMLFLAVLITLTQVACKKSNSPAPAALTQLDGKWRMIIVKDNESNLSVTKPASIQKDVDLAFTSANSSIGTFIGNTPTNDIGTTEYSIGSNQTISIPALAMTKVGETSWGILFVDNIRSAREYSFENGRLLNIKTTYKTLIFRKL